MFSVLQKLRRRYTWEGLCLWSHALCPGLLWPFVGIQSSNALGGLNPQQSLPNEERLLKFSLKEKKKAQVWSIYFNILKSLEKKFSPITTAIFLIINFFKVNPVGSIMILF